MTKEKEVYFLEIGMVFLFILAFVFFPALAFCRDSRVNISVSATVSGGAPSPQPPGGGALIPPPAKVIFEGRAYPLAHITILKNGIVTATFQALPSGLFKKELTGVPGGIYTFGIFAEDSEGRKSVTLSFSVSVLAGRTTTISGIFISPTISLEPTQVEKGSDVNIFGQAFPESQVGIFISSPREMVKKATTTAKGEWAFKLNTGSLEEREHQTRAKALYGEGEQSPFSQTLSFLVLPRGALVCKGADLNFDGKVNIIDFSILLYFWEQTNPVNACADINFDGIINIVDFSIMMYYWNGG